MGVFLNSALNPNFLFQGPSLRDALQRARQEAATRLRGWDPDTLLATAEVDVVEELLGIAVFKVPELHRDRAHLEERPQEITQEIRTFVGGTTNQTVTRRTLIVPISGPATFFQMTATQFSPSALAGQIDSDDNVLLLHCDGMTDPTQITAHFNRELDLIQERLLWTQADVNAHNKAMEAEISAQVAARRTKLLNDRSIQASIGFPIKRRDANDTYSVALTRRTIRPRRASPALANPYTPEPTLDEADYEAALGVLHRARNALERSPSMTSKLGEEEIRDLLLVILNDHFEGNAGGEVFNCSGKTDILIREQDRNIFIAECKIVDPRHKQSVEKVVADALKQLLGYLTWRDTKAALVLFVRDADLTTTTGKAIATIKQHSNYKRDGQITNDERHDVVLHANGDPNREIRLALLAFHVGNRPGSQRENDDLRNTCCDH